MDGFGSRCSGEDEGSRAEFGASRRPDRLRRISFVRNDLLLQLHMTPSSECREVVRAWVEELDAPQWQALHDRAKANGSLSKLDDAIVWSMLRIAGPTLISREEALQANGEFDQLINARARIVLGEVDMLAAETGLTRREVIRWAQSSEVSPSAWLLAQHELEGVTSYVPVARWAIRMAASEVRREALLRDRDIGGVGGSALARLDEIKPCDLGDSVIETLEAASRRVVEEEWDGPNELDIRRSWEKQLPDGCIRLVTFYEIHREGARLRHCVGTDNQYAQGVLDRTHEIFSLTLGEEQATAQVATSGRIIQVSGLRNGPVSSQIMELVEQCRKAMP